MDEFPFEGIDDDESIDDSIPHPSPDEIGIWSFDDPGFIEELHRRFADDSDSIPWSELRKEPINRRSTD